MLVKLFLSLLLFGCGSYASSKDQVLIGGQETEPGQFEEVVRIRSGGAGCSASVIGPRVVLTAAHCIQGDIEDVSKVVYEIQSKRQLFRATCKIAPDYRQQVGDQDMAVCKSDRDLPEPYASIAAEGPKLDEMVTLIGYGCIQPGGGGGNDGILRYGDAKVTRESDDAYYSFHTLGASALCFGDSGGPAFKLVDDPKGHHYVYGVNSRGNIRDLSLLTAVYHPKSIQFMKDYEVSEGVQICGLSKKCVDDDPAPPECKEFEERVDAKKKLVEKRELMLKRAQVQLRKAEKKLQQCRSGQ